jgi:sugar/nucleoside kinase (ribokinase family)
MSKEAIYTISSPLANGCLTAPLAANSKSRRKWLAGQGVLALNERHCAAALCGFHGRTGRIQTHHTFRRTMKGKNTSAGRGLIAGGNWVIDQVKIIDVFPQPERLATILSQSEGTGGAPYNVSIGLAKSGAPFPIYAAGLVGNDPQGQRILQDCKEHKIDTHFLGTTDKAATSYTDVMTERHNGRRTFFHYRGANSLWRGQGLDFAKLKARLFHLGYLLLLDALDEPDDKFGTKAARLLSAAREAGLKTSVDVVSEESDRYQEVVTPALKHVDSLFVNEFEAGKITGFKTRAADGRLDTVALRHTAGALLQLGVRDLVIIHFREGAFARTRKGEDFWQSAVNLPAKCIAGTVGAGDAFCAGVLIGLHEGWELPRSLMTGMCVAAACLSDPTTTGGIRSLNTSLALGKKYGFEPSLEPKEP